MDGRGHGASDKPTDPESYALDLRVADVLAVMDDLQIERADYLGYSMGGWIGLGVASSVPERIGSLVVGGAHPYGQNLAFFRQAMRQGIEPWVAMAEKTAGPKLTAADRERLRANDVRALQACIARDRPDISDRLSALTMPCLLFAGSADGVRDKAERCARELPRGTFYLVPGMNHFELAFHIDVMVPAIRSFLETGSLPE
jgi:pimeloyl-ACP methyl ester carboxylesterase